MKVYQYGLLPPTDNNVLVREQMRAAHRYQNELIKIERDRRDAERALMEQHRGLQWLTWAAQYADAECEAATQAIKSARAKTRSRSESDAAKEIHAAAKIRRREALRTLAFGRALVRASSDANTIYEEVNAKVKTARAACKTLGPYWGSYLLSEKAAEDATFEVVNGMRRKMPLYDGTEPRNPHFKRWTGDGAVSVQLQGGMTVAEALGGEDTQLRILNNGTSKNGRRAFARLMLRVSSDGRNPIWAEWPMVMHRPLPEGARIKVATVSCRRDGHRERWTCEITLDTLPVAPHSGSRLAVGVDLGWRAFGDELRVCYWCGEDGAEGELRLDAAVTQRPERPANQHRRSVRTSFGTMQQLTKASELRAQRDINFNAARDALVAWLRTAEMPEWMRALTVKRGETPPSQAQALAYLVQWRAPARLGRLRWRWLDARIDGDTDAFAALSAWEKQDRHLWQWETDQRHQALERRKHLYRNFAAQMAKRYSVLVLEKFNLSKMAKRPDIDEAADSDAAQSQRYRAATSILRDALCNAFLSSGGSVEEVPAAGTTRLCHECGEPVIGDAATKVVLACKNGHAHDQDKNAGINILGRRERPAGDEPPGAARSDEKDNKITPEWEGRWTKRTRNKRERDEKNEAARKDKPDAAE